MVRFGSLQGHVMLSILYTGSLFLTAFSILEDALGKIQQVFDVREMLGEGWTLLSITQTGKYEFSHDLRRGAQGASREVPGKLYLFWPLFSFSLLHFCTFSLATMHHQRRGRDVCRYM